MDDEIVLAALVAHLQDIEGPSESLEDGVLRFFRYIAQSGLQQGKPIFGCPLMSSMELVAPPLE